MAKRRKAATKKAAKKSTKKPTKARAKKSAAGQKRKSARSKPPQEMSFFDHFLKNFAPPETGKRNGR
jgi:hypothetical protein